MTLQSFTYPYLSLRQVMEKVPNSLLIYSNSFLKIEYIRIIRLPKRIQANRFLRKGVTVKASGWGCTKICKLLILYVPAQTSTNNLHYLIWLNIGYGIVDYLLNTKINLLTSVDCIKAFGKLSYSNITNLCAMGKNGNATCQVMFKINLRHLKSRT